MSLTPFSHEEIERARERIRGHAHVTPVLTSRCLDDAVHGRIYLKCESFQRVGAFKYRGAHNAIAMLSDEERARGVIAYSSGNHAQAVALASRRLGVRSTIVMPANAPAVKRAATEGYGASVIEYDPEKESREEIAAAVAADRELVVIPPYDHRNVIAGQGTAAWEFCEEVGILDDLIVPCGGGGLLSGSAVAARAVSPGCRVIGIEPEVADDATRSFRTGELHTVRNPDTIADGTRTPSLGEVTFPLVREYVEEMQTVTESAIADAVRFLLERLKIVVEPSGALGVAALLSGSVKPWGRTGVIISGGNIDPLDLQRILAVR